MKHVDVFQAMLNGWIILHWDTCRVCTRNSLSSLVILVNIITL